ncbi:MAG TPA: N-acetylneuraminate synthase family protein [Ignavibacteriaceae bacterium]|nr:N-acetylneuraminate synthase family protein [Ignavibacteriaceae bacterium]
MRSIKVGKINIGDGHPVFIVAEIGINHNGSLEIAKKLIEGAKAAGCDAVKFQKRTPEICVPKDQWNIERETPWGRMTYINYRHRVEFTKDDYSEIDRFCKEKDIVWFASCWDEEAVDFIQQFDVPIFKTASASLTDKNLLLKHIKLNKPTIISTGMSTMEEIEEAEKIFEGKNILIAHATSSYPCPNEELNLKMITTLREKYPEIPIGYSGHETGLAPTWAAVSLGASFVERHITLDRAMWGSDQAASVEPNGFNRLVRNIRDIEIALGDGIKRVYPSEMSARTKLRRVK